MMTEIVLNCEKYKDEWSGWTDYNNKIIALEGFTDLRFLRDAMLQELWIVHMLDKKKISFTYNFE